VARQRVIIVARLSLILAAILLLAAPPAAPAGAAARAGGAASGVCFIRGIYRDVLGRLPDPLEVSSGQSYLGSHTNAEYALTLVTSNEYRVILIQSWYQRFLGRAATSGEISAWQFDLGSGASDEHVIAVILGSNEYYSQSRVSNDPASLVQAVYHDLLERAPSPIESSTWQNYLNTHSRQQFAEAILASAEYQTVIIKAWYRRYLGREATDGEAAASRGILNGPGGSDEKVIANLLGSPEYYARAAVCLTYLPLVSH
jgi:hypothetical protein